MKKILSMTMVLAIILIATSCDYENPVVQDVPQSESIKGMEITDAAKSVRKIVVFDSDYDLSSGEAFVKSKGASVNKKLKLINAIAVSLPANASEKAKKAILGNSNVLRIDDDIVVKAPPPGKGKDKDKEPPSSDPQDTPWGISTVNADGLSNNGSGVKVGILDTGIDLDHPDLKDNIGTGINILSSRKNEDDDNGHGTHVAGTIGAIDNSIGVVGVAPEVTLYGVKVLDRRGSGWLSDIIDGLQWCIDNDMDVVNMSIGSNSGNSSYEAALNKAYNAGIVLIAAAGNDGDDGGVDYPARYTNVMAVSAIDNQGNLASFSDYGNGDVSVTAPGVGIFSTYKGGDYRSANGTSMASPHAAGVAALIVEKYSSYTPAQVYALLKSSANSTDYSDTDKFGAGLVDATEATK